MERAHFDALDRAIKLYDFAQEKSREALQHGNLAAAEVYIEKMGEMSETITALQEAIKAMPPARARRGRKMPRRRPKENLKPKNYSRWQ